MQSVSCAVVILTGLTPGARRIHDGESHPTISHAEEMPMLTRVLLSSLLAVASAGAFGAQKYDIDQNRT
jgi:hypothetical protein